MAKVIGNAGETPVSVDTMAVEAIVRANEKNANVSIMNRERNRIEIRSGNTTVETELNVTIENSTMTVGNTKLKVLPEQASERAKEVIKALNVKRIVLKEQSGKLVYSVNGLKKGNLLFFLPVEMEVNASLDAETNQVVATETPWWGFLVA
ncbi:MAG: hypothetical protein DRO99_02220 [Candidatus Aenigmatarchaeota archaeon]|nr:MAG: hypothetical protein DRO99_02220 [Candidatus Aenigmarchaeota archaeon]